jgi:beta-lactam-binding protein with PASTA domain
MSACPSCGFENPENRDFCPKCGTYTRWDPTVHVAAVRPPTPDAEHKDQEEEVPPPIVTGVPAAVAEGVIVTVRKAGDEAADAPVELTLLPGSQALLTINVRNQSGIVDNYDLELRGMPQDWWTIEPPTVYLVPYGAAGGSYEQEATLRLHPPRSPEAEARAWPIEIVARSRAREADAGSATATITLEPYSEIESELRPEIATGRRGAEFAIAVRNVANAPVDVAVAALDNEGACRFDFDKPQLSAPPGRRDGTPFHVRPPKQMIFGRTKERRFTVTAQVIGSEAAARPQPAVFRQRPWIPAWVLPIVPILIAAGVAFWALKPNTTKVPSLAGSTVFAAQQKLDDAGLKLGQKTTVPTTKVKAGTIINSVPAAGKSVDKGKEINILVAVGTGKFKVPVVVGLTVNAADVRLRAKGFTIGLTPKFDDGAVAMITGQAPEAGKLEPKGTAIDLTLDPSTVTAPTTTATTDTTPSTGGASTGGASTGGASTGGTGGQTTSGSGAGLLMPALAGVAFGAAINKLGGAVKVTRAHAFDDTVPLDQIVSSDPPPKTKLRPGQTVTLTISLGPPPPIAFSNNNQILLMSSAGKLEGQPIGASGVIDEEPTWNRTGNRIAYRQQNADQTSSIWVVNPAKPQAPRQLTGNGFIDRRPSFSPSGHVIAFVRASTKANAPYRLCFKRVGGSGLIPLCVPSPDATLSFARPAWAPDGHAISVIVQTDPKDPGQTEVGLFVSGKANSPVPSDWQYKGVITDKLHGHAPHQGALFAAWSPGDGSTLAISANWGSPFYHLELLPMLNDLPKPGAKPVAVARVHSCEISWRGDGLQLAVLSSDPDQCTSSKPAPISTYVVGTRPPKIQPLQSGFTPAWSPAIAKP